MDLPEDILKTVSVIPLTLIIAVIGKPDRSLAVVNIEISYKNTEDTSRITFPKPLYYGKYITQSGEVKLGEEITILTDQPDDNIEVLINNEFSSYFVAVYSGKTVTITMGSTIIPPATLNSLTNIPLVLVAKIKNTARTATVVLNLGVENDSRNNTRNMAFAQLLYTGDYSIVDGKIIFKTNEKIQIITDIPETEIASSLTIDSEYAKYFRATFANKIVSVIPLDQIPDDLLKSNAFIALKLTVRTNDSTISSSAVLTIRLSSNPDVDTGSITFSNILYAGTYDVTGSSPAIKYDSISLITNETDDNIQVHITNGFSEYFAITQAGKSVTISLTKAIPADTLKALTTIAITLDAKTVKPSKTTSAVLNLRVIKTEEDKTGFVSFAKVLHIGQYSVIGGAGILTLNDKIQVITDRVESDIETNITDSSGYGEYFALSYSSGTISVSLKKNLPDDVFNTISFISLTITASIKNTNQRSSTVLNIRLDIDKATISFESFIYNGKYSVEDGKAFLQYDPISVKTDKADDNVEVSIVNGYASFFKVGYSGKLVTVDLKNAVPSATLQNLSNIPLELMVQIKGTQHSAYAVLNLKVVDKDNTHNTDVIAFAKVLYSGIYSKKDLKDERPSFKVDSISVITDAMATEIEISASNDYGYDKYFKFSYSNNEVSVDLKETIPTDVLKDNDFIPLTLTIKLKSSGKAASAVLNIRVDYGHDDDKESSVDTTGYIVAIVILTLLLIGLIVGASAFYYFRIRNRKYVEMEDEFGKFRFGKQAKPAPKSVRSSTIEERRPTGFNFRPMDEDDLAKFESSTEPAEKKERRKSVAFDDNVLKHEIDQVNDYDIDKAHEGKNEVTAI